MEVKDFDVSAIFHMNDAVLDVQDRDHVLGGILTPAPPFWLHCAVSRRRFGRRPPCLSTHGMLFECDAQLLRRAMLRR